MKNILRKRGADTNQNIFYLVIAVIVLSAAGYGFDQAIKSMARSEAVRNAETLSGQIKAIYMNVGNLPAFNIFTIREANILPASMINRNSAGVVTDITMPAGGRISATVPSPAGSRNFTINYYWGSASSRARGICRHLAMGAGEVNTSEGLVEKGPLGENYMIMTTIINRCAGVNAALNVRYFR